MIGKGKRVDNFETPAWLFKILDDRFNFTVDAAATSENKKCQKMLNCGLTDSWTGERVFCNPPFSQKKLWMEKAAREVENGCPVCVMLLPTNSMSSTFWNDIVFGRYNFEIITTRVFFIDPETKKEKKESDSGTTVVYFMRKIDARKRS